MKVRPIAIIILIVLLPMILLSWAAVQLDRSERMASEQRYRQLLEGRLKDINKTVARTFASIDRKLQSLLRLDEVDLDRVRETTRNEPFVSQLFALNERGELLYPNPTQVLNTSERSFLLSASKMFTSMALREAVTQRETPNDQKLSHDVASRSSSVQAASNSLQEPLLRSEPFAESQGWFVWYWDQGLHLIRWQRRPNGNIVGVALERSRWIADLIAELPDTDRQSTDESHFRLVNDSSETIYQWGNYIPLKESLPIGEVPVAEPLQAWRLQAFLPPKTAGADLRRRWITSVGFLAAIGLGLGSMAWVLYRDYRNSVLEAMQQVSFVNQVSHELKTPLTNIQLYAELLQKDFSEWKQDEGELAQKRVEVVIAETQRLGRLINNVLSHARQRRGTLQPILREQIPDEVIMGIVHRFGPSLAASEIMVEMELNAKRPQPFDSDFLEQILGNLISNAEKYAAQGKWLRIESLQSDHELGIVVEDRGAGIEPGRRADVFKPFAKRSNHISSVSGTGIGLSIARELSRLLGGDLTLESSEMGCRFRVVIRNSP